MTLFVSGLGLAAQITVMVCLGLFMSGSYSTILTNAGHIFSEYRVAFGYFVTIAGLGTAIMPSIIGIIAERHGMQAGMKVFVVAAFAYLAITIWNATLDKKLPAK